MVVVVWGCWNSIVNFAYLKKLVLFLVIVGSCAIDVWLLEFFWYSGSGRLVWGGRGTGKREMRWVLPHIVR